MKNFKKNNIITLTLTFIIAVFFSSINQVPSNLISGSFFYEFLFLAVQIISAIFALKYFYAIIDIIICILLYFAFDMQAHIYNPLENNEYFLAGLFNNQQEVFLVNFVYYYAIFTIIYIFYKLVKYDFIPYINEIKKLY
jgi:hypothetical protein